MVEAQGIRQSLWRLYLNRTNFAFISFQREVRSSLWSWHSLTELESFISVCVCVKLMLVSFVPFNHLDCLKVDKKRERDREAVGYRVLLVRFIHLFCLQNRFLEGFTLFSTKPQEQSLWWASMVAVSLWSVLHVPCWEDICPKPNKLMHFNRMAEERYAQAARLCWDFCCKHTFLYS